MGDDDDENEESNPRWSNSFFFDLICVSQGQGQGKAEMK